MPYIPAIDADLSRMAVANNRAQDVTASVVGSVRRVGVQASGSGFSGLAVQIAEIATRLEGVAAWQRLLDGELAAAIAAFNHAAAAPTIDDAMSASSPAVHRLRDAGSLAEQIGDELKSVTHALAAVLRGGQPASLTGQVRQVDAANETLLMGLRVAQHPEAIRAFVIARREPTAKMLVDDVVGSLRAEGLTPDPALRAMADDHVAGRRSLAELHVEALRLAAAKRR